MKNIFNFNSFKKNFLIYCKKTSNNFWLQLYLFNYLIFKYNNQTNNYKYNFFYF
uniref:Uncharacterized protein n=1 Tax=Nephromyces sp. ex Molgula occidentalis TaxID=2544991 RepID=A0A5C1H7E5_9APIC|nr:hypothetical protein [Nephromyces sp. ex Molgula occidentalis]